MTGNKKNILQRQSFSEVQMSRSSQTCKTLSIYLLYTGFRPKYYAGIQMTSFSGKVLSYFSKTVLTCTLHLLQHSFIVEECVCWTGLPDIQTFYLYLLNPFGESWNVKYDKEDSGLLSRSIICICFQVFQADVKRRGST